MRKVPFSSKLNVKIKIRVLRCYVYSVLLYGVEACNRTEAIEKRMESFEKSKIAWTQYVMNLVVIRKDITIS